jgi:hypothetical protein
MAKAARVPREGRVRALARTTPPAVTAEEEANRAHRVLRPPAEAVAEEAEGGTGLAAVGTVPDVA